MEHLWQQLRVGDRVRLTHIPTELQQPGVTFLPETRALYERVIAERAVLTVYEIDEYGSPWVMYPDSPDLATDWFAIDHPDGIELVERATP